MKKSLVKKISNLTIKQILHDQSFSKIWNINNFYAFEFYYGCTGRSFFRSFKWKYIIKSKDTLISYEKKGMYNINNETYNIYGTFNIHSISDHNLNVLNKVVNVSNLSFKKLNEDYSTALNITENTTAKQYIYIIFLLASLLDQGSEYDLGSITEASISNEFDKIKNKEFQNILTMENPSDQDLNIAFNLYFLNRAKPLFGKYSGLRNFNSFLEFKNMFIASVMNFN